MGCRCLHCRPFVGCLARCRLSKQKGQAAEVIHGLVPRTKEFCEEVHGNLHFQNGMKKPYHRR